MFSSWISAFRLRTLPLALSAVLMGTFLADIYAGAQMPVLLLTLLTAVSLQILSNLANDYGDFKKGTDNAQRLGNTRALQSGKITPPQMMVAMIIFVIISLASGISLLLYATGGSISIPFIAFFLTGIAAIVAAIKYTVGKNPYGYSGFGDVFVFLFFGPVAVGGTFLLHSHFVFDPGSEWPVYFAVAALGLLCTGVLNTNNIRDIENDAASGKRTVPVKTGLPGARKYHVFLVAGACIMMVLFLLTAPVSPLAWITCLAFVPLVMQMIKVCTLQPSPAFNGLLKQLSLGTLLLVLLLIVAEIVSQALQLFTVIDTYGN